MSILLHVLLCRTKQPLLHSKITYGIIATKHPKALTESAAIILQRLFQRECVYVGETGRPLGARVKEHHKEMDSITGIFTRAEKTRAASICNKSVITRDVVSRPSSWALEVMKNGLGLGS